VNGGTGSKRTVSPEAAAAPYRQRRLTPYHILSVHGLLVFTILIAIVFSILLPDTFPTLLTFRSIVISEAPTAILALGEMTVIACGQFDLSIGYGVGATAIVAVVLQVHSGFPWALASLAAILFGCLIGLANGIIVHFAKIDSFIVTLGVGYIIYSFSEWYTGGQEIVGTLPSGFQRISGGALVGIPLPGIYAIILAIIIWVVMEFFPVGRYVYALGSNRRAAELSGIRPGRYIVGTFVVSGLLVGVAGVVLASSVSVATTDNGPDFLLPAFVAALLGAATIRPGRVNAWGTIVAVLILAVGVAGIQQFGGSFFVSPLFNGVMLIVAVGIAGYASRRRRAAASQPPSQTRDEVQAGDGGAAGGTGVTNKHVLEDTDETVG
jgi:ribose transport system permease protein